jgi:penicillin amidase
MTPGTPRPSSTVPETRYVVNGIGAQAEILIDEYSIAHIYSDSTTGLYFAQGFNAARERLFQLDLTRRAGLGLLSEVYGESFVERDRASRLFLYRGDMDMEWESYGVDMRSISEAFVAGVNAYIGLAEAEPNLMPPEFIHLGYRPSLWDPRDVVRIRARGVVGNALEEALRARTLHDLGVEVEQLRAYREPFAPLVVPDGLDLSVFSEDVLRLYELATLPPAFQSDRASKPVMDGSNNWVVSGSRTATGRPVLCNDPHRDTSSLPGLRYLVHLSGPDFDVIGAGEPHIPGISLGHNGSAAFGFTIFFIDQEDVYVYELHLDSPRRYRHKGEWLEFESVTDQVHVKDGSSVDVELTFSVHGPIVHINHERNTAIGVRAAWLEPGMAPYLGGLACMTAKNWPEFLNAVEAWGTPGENMIFADTDGNIGWKATGAVPRRDRWDGTLPVPGDGRFEWDGYHPRSDLPTELNPANGWISTANQYPFTENDALRSAAGVFWASPERKQRIDERLASTTHATVRELYDLQFDTISIPARRVVTVLRELPFTADDEIPGLHDLLEWDHAIDADSRAAAIYELWMRRHLRPGVLRRLLEVKGVPDIDAAMNRLLEPSMMVDDRIVIEAMERRRGLGDDPEDFLVRLVTHTLAATWTDLEDILGSQDAQWRWGRLAHSRSDHPLRQILQGFVADEHLHTEPTPRSGSAQTLQVIHYDEQLRQTAGATVRVAIDVGDWDESLAMNAPGQSGDWRSPHYQDLFTPWAEGSAIPLLYSRDRIAKATRHRIELAQPNPADPQTGPS